ncbi:MAG TPA: tetratricopeptide repeat protein [Acetobacteraceae bacterium]|jgi:Flp pilus assembly protein TadD|nr:tetratricopeptide repeat protein [Acetobacteraceae bacterium]
MELTMRADPRSWRLLDRLKRLGLLQTATVLALALAGCTGAQQAGLSHQPSLRVADAALAGGAPEVAVRVADLTLERDPHNTRALVTKGDALYALGQRDEARAAYRQAVAIEPKLASAQLGLGRTLVQTDPAAAETAFLAALAALPDDSAALNDLGIARDLLGRHAEAQDAYRQALAITPQATDVKMNLGLSLALTGDRDAAVGVLREAAAVPATVQDRPKELAAALSLAGDQRDADRILSTGSARPVADNVASAGMAPPPLLASHKALASVTPMQERRPAGNLAVAARESPPPAPHMMSVPSSILSVPVVAVARATRVPLSQATPDALVDAAAIPVLASVAKPLTFTSPPRRAIAPSTTETAAYVQLASLHSLEDAWFEWHRLVRRLPELLGGHTPVIVQADALGETYWCLRTFGFVDLAAATAMCSEARGASSLRCWARAAF